VKLLGGGAGGQRWQLSYQEKVAELNTLSAQGTGAIRLDSKSFMKFVEHPRNYSLIVVFTATDATHPCDICRCVAAPGGAAAPRTPASQSVGWLDPRGCGRP